MVDMDHTLLESVFRPDARYKKSQGTVIELDHPDDTFKVNIRPGAVNMVHKIVSSGHTYIIWSAGTADYVHAAMAHFSEVAGIKPQKILTREDMVKVKSKERSALGNRFKSNQSHGVGTERLLIIEDDPSLVDPDERERVILVERWKFEDQDDRDMDMVMNALEVFGHHTPVLASVECTQDSRVLRRK